MTWVLLVKLLSESFELAVKWAYHFDGYFLHQLRMIISCLLFRSLKSGKIRLPDWCRNAGSPEACKLTKMRLNKFAPESTCRIHLQYKYTMYGQIMIPREK